MKYLCIGDTHGKIDLVKLALSEKFKEFHKIFVGDYVDSFTLSTEDQIAIVQLLLKKSARNDVTCLIGNHELSYIMDGMRCSGYNLATAQHMIHLKEEIFSKFKSHVYINEDILVTHAGANSKLFPTKESIKGALEANDHFLYDIGRARGGPRPYGGIFWNDFWNEHNNIPYLTQIMGHTAYRLTPKQPGIVEMNGDFNIDCLDRVPEALIVDVEAEDNFKIINLV